jgi:hypothetical protein
MARGNPTIAALSVVVMLSAVAVLTVGVDAAAAPDERQVSALLFPTAKIEEVKALGPGVLPALARLYERSDPQQRATIAETFYALGWKSPDAKRVLMRDVHTQDPNLRLQVQWALGRVSDDPDVVDVLLANMQDDGNPLFRDKAACALANDQIHLSEVQKIRLYEGLIRALRDPKPQVRDIALKALQIQTGQTKGYNPNGSPDEREAAVQAWLRWLQEYRASL